MGVVRIGHLEAVRAPWRQRWSHGGEAKAMSCHAGAFVCRDGPAVRGYQRIYRGNFFDAYAASLGKQRDGSPYPPSGPDRKPDDRGQIYARSAALHVRQIRRRSRDSTRPLMPHGTRQNVMVSWSRHAGSSAKQLMPRRRCGAARRPDRPMALSWHRSASWTGKPGQARSNDKLAGGSNAPPTCLKPAWGRCPDAFHRTPGRRVLVRGW